MTRTAVVAGGAGSIGRLIAGSYAADGYLVHLIDLSDDLVRVAEDLGASPVSCDVTDFDQVVAATAHIGPVDALVNAVGMWPQQSIDELTVQTWNKVLAVNLTGTFVVVKALVTQLRQGHGAVVNFASSAFLRGSPQMIAYSAAKAGVLGLSRSLARALGPDGVRVNTVIPGIVTSESNREMGADEFARARGQRALGRDGDPAELVGAVRFLTSDAASFVTGQSLVVDGGIFLE